MDKANVSGFINVLALFIKLEITEVREVDNFGDKQSKKADFNKAKKYSI